MAYGRLSHARGPTGRLPTTYILNDQISLLTINRSVDSAVRPLVCSRMYTPCIRIHHMVSPECRLQNVSFARISWRKTIQFLLALSLFSSSGLLLTLVTFTHHRESCLESVLVLV